MPVTPTGTLSLPFAALRENLAASTTWQTFCDADDATEAIARIVSTVSDHDIDPKRLAARIRTWSRRGQLHSHGSRVVDGQTRPTYRVGDVLVLLQTDRRVSTVVAR